MPLLKTSVTLSVATGEAVTFGNVGVTVPLNTGTQSGASANALTNGTGAGQANHSQDVNIASSTGGVTVDLTAVTGGLDGKTRDWSNGSTGHIKCIIIENLDATNTITLGQPESNGWTVLGGSATGFSYPIEPTGIFHLYSPGTGLAVTSSSKEFTLTSDSGTPLAKITIIGIGA
jgi:hypothetical protein